MLDGGEEPVVSTVAGSSGAPPRMAGHSGARGFGLDFFASMWCLCHVPRAPLSSEDSPKLIPPVWSTARFVFNEEPRTAQPPTSSTTYVHTIELETDLIT